MFLDMFETEKQIFNRLLLTVNPSTQPKTCKMCPITKGLTQSNSTKYYLTGVVMIRVFAADKSNWTTRDLIEWIKYVQYAGIEHLYIYDNFFSADEKQEPYLQDFIQSGYVTYIDWSFRGYKPAQEK